MDINGTWYNELGSQMTLKVNGKKITGLYQTKVGDATGDYELVGQIDTDNDESTAIGWTVLWTNKSGSSDSVTSWSGQVQIINEKESIVTTWLLTAETDVDDDWHSTFIGKDIFTRLQPSEDKIVEGLLKGIKYPFPANLKNK